MTVILTPGTLAPDFTLPVAPDYREKEGFSERALFITSSGKCTTCCSRILIAWTTRFCFS